MRFRNAAVICAVGGVLVFPGCATAGPSSDDLRSTVFATHRIVQGLEANLSGTVSKLSETTASLTTRLDATDQELRHLSSIAQENQRKIERLQTSLDSLTATLYRHFNLSPPQPIAAPAATFPSIGAATGPTPILGGGVVVEPTTVTGPRPAATTPGPTTILPPLDAAGAPSVAAPAPIPSVTAADEVEHYRSAQALYARDDFAGALKQYDDYLKQFPNSSNTGNAAFWKAQCSLRLNDYPQAIMGFEEMRARYPTSDKVPTAMHNQAVAYSRLGQNQRAIELFQLQIREYPDHPATEGAREKLRQLQAQP